LKNGLYIKKYYELCHIIYNSSIQNFTVKDYLLKKPKKFIILRHDVDRSPENVLNMILIENSVGFVVMKNNL